MKNFNHTYKTLLFILGTLGSTAAVAAEATIPNTFSSGTAAVAAEVNDNFTALKSAIDDNDSRINTPSGGFITVSSQAFRNEITGIGCEWGANSPGTYGFYTTNSISNCDAVAGIQLPHNATMASLTCHLFDNSLTDDLRARLYRINLSSGIINTVFSTAASTDSASNQALSDTTTAIVGGEIIDNENYAYSLRIEYSTNTNTQGATLRVYGCTVAY
jgi:hypothetical protein